jgi:hypothetical protein
MRAFPLIKEEGPRRSGGPYSESLGGLDAHFACHWVHAGAGGAEEE